MTLNMKSLIQIVVVVGFLLLGQLFIDRLPIGPEPEVELPSSGVILEAWPADGEVELRWTLGDLASALDNWEYQQRLAGGSYGMWTAIPERASPERRYGIEGLTNGLVYVFRVRLSNGNRVGWSNEATVVPIPMADGPPPPTDSCNSKEFGEVRFALNSYTIDMDFQGNRSALTKIIRKLESEVTADRRVLVTGYASAGGRASYNLDLSERRANRVAGYLEERVDAELAPLAMGERHEEVIPDRLHEKHQRVAVRLCEAKTEDLNLATDDQSSGMSQ